MAHTGPIQHLVTLGATAESPSPVPSTPSVEVHDVATSSTASALRVRFADRLIATSDYEDDYHDYYGGIPATLALATSGDKIVGSRLVILGRWDVLKATYGEALKGEHASSKSRTQTRLCAGADAFESPKLEQQTLESSRSDDGAAEVMYGDTYSNRALVTIRNGTAPGANVISNLAILAQTRRWNETRLSQRKGFDLDWTVANLKLAPDAMTPARLGCTYYKGRWGGDVDRLGDLITRMPDKAPSTALVPQTIFGELKTDLFMPETSQGRAVTIKEATTADWRAFEKTIAQLEKEHGPATMANDVIDPSGHRYAYRDWAPPRGARPHAVIAMSFEQDNPDAEGTVKVLISSKPYGPEFETLVGDVPDPKTMHEGWNSAEVQRIQRSKSRSLKPFKNQSKRAHS